MEKNAKIPEPIEWLDLTAGSTRFGIMYELYSIVHWHDPRYADRLGTYIKGICDTFFDDYPMAENPESMIGQSLYKEEIPQVRKFILEIGPFLDEFDLRKWFNEVEHKKIRKDMIKMPKNVIESADRLYKKMLRKGDPEMDKYY